MKLGTFNARLEGMHNLVTKPEYWSMFGQGSDLKGTKHGGEFATHDQVSRLVLRFGVVGLAAMVALVSFCLSRLHRIVWLIPPGSRERLLGTLGIVFLLGTIGLGASAGGGIMRSFPGPTFLFLAMTVTAMAVRDAVRERKIRVVDAEERVEPKLGLPTQSFGR